MMNTSETIGNLALALCAAQAELKNPKKDRKAKIESSKGRYFYNYADFADALDHIRPTLAKQSLALVQATSIRDGNYVILETRLMHKSGEWISTEYPVGLVADHRTLGSSLSYARRYSAFSLLAIQGEDEDDDGEQASQPAPRGEPAPTMAQTGEVESLGQTYVRKFNAAETAEAFEAEVEKARAAWGRMNAADRKKVSDSIEARRVYWANQAFEGAEVVETK